MHAFVVRVWEPGAVVGDAERALRGLVRHVSTGREATFTNDDELVAFVHAVLDWDRRAERPPAPERE